MSPDQTLYYAPFYHQLHTLIGEWLPFLSAVFLLIAIVLLPFERKYRLFIFGAVAIFLPMAYLKGDINTLTLASILLVYSCVKRGKDKIAPLFIWLSGAVNLIGFAGLVYFFFSSRKKTFLLYTLLWGAIFAASQLIILGGIHGTIETYTEWYALWEQKNLLNLQDETLNISWLGLQRELIQPLWGESYRDRFFFITAMHMLLLPVLKTRHMKEYSRMPELFLGSILMFLSLFNTGNTLSSLIMPAAGVMVWTLFSAHKSGLKVSLFALYMLSYMLRFALPYLLLYNRLLLLPLCVIFVLSTIEIWKLCYDKSLWQDKAKGGNALKKLVDHL
ncbi:MAG: glycosyltransferase 87 family protein [Porphyromonas sp.]|nr:glycosyltransferase 87 family protein [Porphyromonas sp.]